MANRHGFPKEWVLLITADQRFAGIFQEEFSVATASLGHDWETRVDGDLIRAVGEVEDRTVIEHRPNPQLIFVDSADTTARFELLDCLPAEVPTCVFSVEGEADAFLRGMIETRGWSVLPRSQISVFTLREIIQRLCHTPLATVSE